MKRGTKHGREYGRKYGREYGRDRGTRHREVLSRLLRIGVVGLVLVWFASPALADEVDDGSESESERQEDYQRPGLYVGLGYVYGLENWKYIEANNTMGLGFQLGYRVNSWAATEINLEWLSDFRNDLPGQVGVINTQIKGKFYPPIPSRFQPYAVVGIGILATLSTDSEESGIRDDADWATKTGVGIDIYAWGPVVLNLEATYVWTLGSVEYLDYGSFGAGLMYRF